MLDVRGDSCSSSVAVELICRNLSPYSVYTVGLNLGLWKCHYVEHSNSFSSRTGVVRARELTLVELAETEKCQVCIAFKYLIGVFKR